MRRYAVLCLAFLLTSLGGKADPVFQVTDLGDLPGGDDVSIPWGLNNLGQVVGLSYVEPTPPFGGRHAFLWTSATGMIDLGTFHDDNHGESVAHDINDIGQVVGWSSSPQGPLGFIWAPGAMELRRIDDPMVRDTISGAMGINNYSEVVGSSWFEGVFHAYLWDSETRVVQVLDDIPGGIDQSGASAVSDEGQVVGWGRGAVGAEQAVLWDLGAGTIEPLGFLREADDLSRAEDMNNRGQVVGSSSNRFGSRAFIWESGMGMKDLGNLSSRSTFARAINEAGAVVGGSDGRAFIWTEAAGMADLNNLLDDAHPLPSSLVLLEARDINDHGQIVAIGALEIPPGARTQHAILLTPADIDGDGVPNDEDACPTSNTDETVIIHQCDTRVANTVLSDGCTISDEIELCAEDAKNHGQFVRCVSLLTNALKRAGIITGRERGSIQRCAAKADIP